MKFILEKKVLQLKYYNENLLFSQQPTTSQRIPVISKHVSGSVGEC